MYTVINVLFLVILTWSVDTKTVDNKLIGTPEVKCGPNEIRITGRTEDIFEGQIFVKKKRRQQECFVVYDVEMNSTTPSLAIPMDQISTCGIEMKRNAETKSLDVFAIIAIAFHPSFIMAGDRAFAVHCEFQQKQFTVAANVDFISDITTKAVLGGILPMPALSLSITDGSVPINDSSSVLPSPPSKISVGQPLMLVWHLEQKNPLYGLRVLSCTAESESGKIHRIIDNGCSTDRVIVGDVKTSSNAQRSYADLTAFKFPDMSDVIIKCAVKYCIVRFAHLVVGNTDTSDLCAESPDCSRLHPNRLRRSVGLVEPVEMGDIEDETIRVIEGRIRIDDEYQSIRYHAEPQVGVPDPPSTVCVSRPLLAGVSALFLSIYSATAIALSLFIFSQFKHSKFYAL